MKKLYMLGLVGSVLALPVAHASADAGVVQFNSCIATSDGKPLTTMSIRVDNYDRGFADANGCFSVAVAADMVHDIRYSGETSLLDAVPDSNGFQYTFTYRTDYMTEDTTANLVIPVTPVTLTVNGVDGTPIQDPVIQLDAGNVVTLPSGQSVSAQVRGDVNEMRGSGNSVLFAGIDGLQHDYVINTPAGTGYERFLAAVPQTSGTALTTQAVLQYPAPPTVDDVTTDVDVNGHAVAHWVPAAGTSAVNIYRYTDNGPVLVVSLPGTATSYDLGTMPAQGSYSYAIRSANQYGYEGNQSRGLSVVWDLTGPQVNHAILDSTDIEVGTETTFNVAYTDPESGVQRVEYFIDTDPGAGNATQLNLQNDTYDYVDPIGGGLAAGTYTIGVRALDTNGNWSGITYLTLTVHEAPVVPEGDPTDEG